MSIREDFEAWGYAYKWMTPVEKEACLKAYQAATSRQETKIKALVEALEGLMLWQVRNVKVWHNDAYNQAVAAIQKAKETP